MTALHWLVAALLALLLLAVAGWWRASTRTGRRNRSRQRVALAAENEAERMLGREGFTIVDRQVTQRFDMWVNEEAVEAWCRADLIVTRAGRTYLAEVKTGELAPAPNRAATRRQLREYAAVFEVDGILLVDMVACAIHTVSFDPP